MKRVISFIMLLFSFNLLALEVDTGNSVFKWSATKIGGGHHGKIFLKEHKLKTSGGKLVGGTFVMDMKGFTNEDLSGGLKDTFMTHIKSADFFEVEKYPIATLMINKLDGNKAQGILTIKGKSHPISFKYKVNGKNYSGVMIFDRTKYGMIYGSGNFFKNIGDKLIHDEVKLEFKVVLK